MLAAAGMLTSSASEYPVEQEHKDALDISLPDDCGSVPHDDGPHPQSGSGAAAGFGSPRVSAPAQCSLTAVLIVSLVCCSLMKTPAMLIASEGFAVTNTCPNSLTGGQL